MAGWDLDPATARSSDNNNTKGLFPSTCNTTQAFLHKPKKAAYFFCNATFRKIASETSLKSTDVFPFFRKTAKAQPITDAVTCDQSQHCMLFGLLPVR